MNRIEERFQTLKTKAETAFIPYITAGDPGLEMTGEIVLDLERAGADIVELGVPFSDPVGDGVVIQEAAQRAIARGVSLRSVLNLIREIRRYSEIPILLFSYLNPILAYGFEDFARDASAAGADGVLCVDLPPEEAEDYKAALDKAGLCTVFLAAPTTPEERLDLIAKMSSGFIYYISRLGVTGEQAELSATLREEVARVERHAKKPVAVGFGISTPEQARQVGAIAEAVVVGSAIVRLIASLENDPGLPAEVEAFARNLANAAKDRPE